MVEEQVIAVMFNPASVSPTEKTRALTILGLADSSTCVQVHLRNIMVEYILDPDVINTHPVPSSNKVNMVMIPMETGRCGLRLASLLIESGTILLQNLLHFIVLPYNTHGRFEFRFQRMYLFLATNTMFKDTLAVAYSSITDMLCKAPALSKRFFKSEYLPGVQQALSQNGTWSVNRSLLLDLPRTSLLVPTPPLFKSTQEPTTTETMSNSSDISSPSSMQPNDLAGDFQISSLSQGDKLLQSNYQIFQAIEALTKMMMRIHTPAPGSNGENN
jgi:hypothetical protein